LLTDHLGSVVAVLDATGAVVGEQRYRPFGQPRLTPGITQTDRGYAGQQSLSAAGLVDFNARWVDSSLGMFASPDSLIPNLFNPQALNRYGYVLNNPLRYTDPTGHMLSECGQFGEECGGPLPAYTSPTVVNVNLPAEAVDQTAQSQSPPAPEAASRVSRQGIEDPIWARLPLEQPLELQWYGNTTWARINGADWGYPDFSQGLHPGIDLIGEPGDPVFAGTYGVVVRPGGKYSPGRVDILYQADVTLLYGHITDIQVVPGQMVTPNTVIGYIDLEMEHVHVEILRQVGDQIIMTNPLPYFDQNSRDRLLEVAAGMYSQDTRINFWAAGFPEWRNQWSQPDIIRGGPAFVP